jgi:hypothetical protein
MPQVAFDPTIPVFERAKTVHALDRAATVIGSVVSSKKVKLFLCLTNSALRHEDI